jgi:RNA polymerase sigma-70 factor (ECF subfamily)
VPDEWSELVKRCLAGEPLALREFVERFQQRVFALCLRMLGNRHDAEDAAQESLVRAVRHLNHWDPKRPIEPWVLAIAGNRCRTALERRSRRPVTAATLPEPVTMPPAGNDLGEELQLAIGQLRDTYRETFILFYQHELSCEEISQTLGVPDGTVKTWLHRARKELAETLRQRGLAPEMNHELH